MNSRKSSLNPNAKSYVPLSESSTEKNHNINASEHREFHGHDIEEHESMVLISPIEKDENIETRKTFDTNIILLERHFPDVSSEFIRDILHLNDGKLTMTIETLEMLEDKSESISAFTKSITDASTDIITGEEDESTTKSEQNRIK